MQLLYKEFGYENHMIIDPEVIKDIYTGTNGYVKLIGEEIYIHVHIHTFSRMYEIKI